MQVYSHTVTLKNKDVDLHRRLRTSKLFELLQEASIAHTEALGMGREKTLDRGLLWVVLQQKVLIHRLPCYDETITVVTWPGDTLHVLFPRYYQILDEQGTVLAEASMMWMLVDEKTRKMIFPDRWDIVIPGVRTGREMELPSHMSFPPGEKTISFTVPYSYCDLNGHMNNTHYYDLAEDHIPQAAEGRKISMIEADYGAEILYGEQISVSFHIEEDRAEVSGDGDKNRFRIRIQYCE